MPAIIIFDKMIMFQCLGMEKLGIEENDQQIVLDEDGTIIDDDDVVSALDKNTLLMVLKENESWKHAETPEVLKEVQQGLAGVLNDQNKKLVIKGTTCDGSMRFHMSNGKLALRKPTEEVTERHC